MEGREQAQHNEGMHHRADAAPSHTTSLVELKARASTAHQVPPLPVTANISKSPTATALQAEPVDVVLEQKDLRSKTKSKRFEKHRLKLQKQFKASDKREGASKQGILSFVFGISALLVALVAIIGSVFILYFLAPVLSVVALVLGARSVSHGEGGFGMAGLILGIIGVAVPVLLLLGVILTLLIFVWIMAWYAKV